MNNPVPMSYRIVILHNIISPYKTLLFNELYKICNEFKVLYMSARESNREWDIKKDELMFPHEIMFKGTLDRVNALRVAIKTWGRLNSLNPDVLIIGGYSYAAYWAGLFWAKVNKKKIILWSSSNKEDHKRTFLKELVKSFLIQRCDAYNVYGTKSKEYLIKLGAKQDRIFIVGNNTDNAFYYNETMKWRKTRDTLCQEYNMPAHNFLYIGRFSKEKNIFSLLEAYKKAIDMGDEWGLILVGSGPQKKAIEDYIQKQKIRNVLLPGFQQKSEICKFFAISDVFVLPSVSETWGLVVNEAMATGLPVLVSDRCGCSKDLVKEGVNGFLFDPLDKDSLLGLMNKMTHGEIDLEEMGRHSLEIVKDFTPQRASEVIVKTIELVHNANEE